VPETALRVTYVGHGTVLLEMDGVRILTDPLLRLRVVHLRRLIPFKPPWPDGMGHLDAVLLSHLHFDHLDLPSLRMLDRDVTVVVPRGGAELLLRRRGFSDVRGAVEGTVLNVGPVEVRAVHAQHSGSRGTPWLKGPALGYLLRGSRSVYFAGDTDVFPQMSELAGADLDLLPVAGWGPRLPEGDHLNPLRAAQALRLLTPRMAIPIHWGTYAPIWTRHPNPANVSAGRDFKSHAGDEAPEVVIQVLAPGATFTMPAAADRSAAAPV
jgi:L-ascorbate metabolism protein UlaG (beta-lactamase superfamily)